MSDSILNIQETLRSIVTEYGEGILQDTCKLSSVLCNIAPEQEKAGVLLMLALDKGIGEYYTNSRSMPKERIISRTLDLLKSSFSDECIQEVTAVLFFALGWDTAIVMVYFEEYIRRKRKTEQVRTDTLPEEKSTTNDIRKNAEEKIEDTGRLNGCEVPSGSPMDLQQQVGGLKKRIRILPVIIVLILVGIVIASVLAWISTRKPVSDAGMLQFDLNQDGVVDSNDAAAILGISAKMGVGNESEPDEALIKQADVNGDSLVDASDAAQILLYAAHEGSGNTEP